MEPPAPQAQDWVQAVLQSAGLGADPFPEAYQPVVSVVPFQPHIPWPALAPQALAPQAAQVLEQSPLALPALVLVLPPVLVLIPVLLLVPAVRTNIPALVQGFRPGLTPKDFGLGRMKRVSLGQGRILLDHLPFLLE